MTPLRQRMLDAMAVRGLAVRTQECYSGAIARMALHYQRSPDLLSAAEVEAYLLYLVKDRSAARGPRTPGCRGAWPRSCPCPTRAASAKWMGAANGKPAFSLVLHTWTQELLVCGEPAWGQRLRALYQHDWVVYAKTPLGGPAQVLEYLSRYTHRTAIGNERIRALTPEAVVFSVRADDHGGKRQVHLDGCEFVRRFMQHILPSGLKRIRHYGVLASACKGVKLAQARAALAMPASSPRALESATGFLARVARIDAWRCPCCAASRLRVVQTTAAPARLPAAGAPAPLIACRGPP